MTDHAIEHELATSPLTSVTGDLLAEMERLKQERDQALSLLHQKDAQIAELLARVEAMRAFIQRLRDQILSNTNSTREMDALLANSPPPALVPSDSTWIIETMALINKLTPEIKGKAFDPDWFLLRQRLEQVVPLEEVKGLLEALEGCNEMFDTYGHTSESPCSRDKEIVANMLNAIKAWRAKHP